MFRIVSDFRTYPAGVQKGLGLLLVGWVWFYMSLERIEGFEIPSKMLIAGVFMLLLAGSMKNWARWLCIMCNALAIMYCMFLALVLILSSVEDMTFVTTLVISAILFALPTYYLSSKPASEFYKAYNQDI